MTTEIIERTALDELARQYAEAEAAILRGLETVTEGLAVVQRAFFEGNTRFAYLRTRHGVSLPIGDGPELVEELRRDAWRAVIERSRVRQGMSVAAWADLEKRISSDKPLPLTAENLAGVLDAFKADMPKMLEDAVAEVFSFLRPPRSKYKTNTEFELGDRVVLSCFLDQHTRFSSRWSVNHYRRQEVIALDNVFALLDGRLLSADGPYYGVLRKNPPVPEAQVVARREGLNPPPRWADQPIWMVELHSLADLVALVAREGKVVVQRGTDWDDFDGRVGDILIYDDYIE